MAGLLEPDRPQPLLRRICGRTWASRPRRAFVAILTLLFVTVLYLHVSEDGSPGTRLAAFWHPSHAETTTSDSYFRDTAHPGTLVKDTSRSSDLIDAFANFTRKPWCTFTSLDLHDPFSPLCRTRKSLLSACTEGGRAGGVNAPYAPRRCDMRWYTVPEICEILSRFEQVNVVGDSMMRNLAVALHVLLRMDLENGGRTNWQDDPEGYDCHCYGAFGTGHCTFNSAYSSTMVWEHDPDSMACARADTALVEFNPQLEWPLKDFPSSLTNQLPTTKPHKPHVFLFGHGMWNDVNVTASQLWTNAMTEALTTHMPWLGEMDAFFPRLFITPSAAGGLKQGKYREKQGNEALRRFEWEMGAWVRTRGFEHLGVWNLTVQGVSPDGTHAGLRSNLIKAMFVLNWLDRLDVGRY